MLVVVSEQKAYDVKPENTDYRIDYTTYERGLTAEYRGDYIVFEQSDEKPIYCTDNNYYQRENIKSVFPHANLLFCNAADTISIFTRNHEKIRIVFLYGRRANTSYREHSLSATQTMKPSR